MNERIKELMKQADLDWTIQRADIQSDTTDLENLNKFAKLIVMECINIVKPTQHHEVWAQSYLGGVDGLELLNSKITDIKQNFGVNHE